MTGIETTMNRPFGDGSIRPDGAPDARVASGMVNRGLFNQMTGSKLRVSARHTVMACPLRQSDACFAYFSRSVSAEADQAALPRALGARLPLNARGNGDVDGLVEARWTTCSDARCALETAHRASGFRPLDHLLHAPRKLIDEILPRRFVTRVDPCRPHQRRPLGKQLRSRKLLEQIAGKTRTLFG